MAIWVFRVWEISRNQNGLGLDNPLVQTRMHISISIFTNEKSIGAPDHHLSWKLDQSIENPKTKLTLLSNLHDMTGVTRTMNYTNICDLVVLDNEKCIFHFSFVKSISEIKNSK